MIDPLHDSLEQAQDDVAQIIKAETYFTGVNVLTLRKADITSEINRSLGFYGSSSAVVAGVDKLGVCIIIMPVVGSPDARARTTPGYPLTMNIVARILENPLINDDTTWGFGKRVGDIAIKLRETLSYTQSEAVFSPLVEDAPFYVPVEDPFAPVAYECRWLCHSVRTTSKSRVLQPKITLAGSDITITCATTGASIYYSTDGSVPSSSSGTLYASSFAVATGLTVRARAYKTDSIASDIVKQST
jgi:hypothetical protein